MKKQGTRRFAVPSSQVTNDYSFITLWPPPNACHQEATTALPRDSLGTGPGEPPFPLPVKLANSFEECEGLGTASGWEADPSKTNKPSSWANCKPRWSKKRAVRKPRSVRRHLPSNGMQLGCNTLTSGFGGRCPDGRKNALLGAKDEHREQRDLKETGEKIALMPARNPSGRNAHGPNTRLPPPSVVQI